MEERVRIISEKALREFWEKHPDAEEPLKEWRTIVREADWQGPADVKRVFSTASFVGICTVFNIHGNDYRLVSKIEYRKHLVFIRYVMTHGEYDRGRWRNECGC